MPARPSVTPTSAAYDPVLPPKQAAEYLGRSTRTLRRLQLRRTPMPSTGTTRPGFGYRLSTLNALLASLEEPRARAHHVRSA